MPHVIHPTPIPAKISGCSLWSRPRRIRLQRANTHAN